MAEQECKLIFNFDRGPHDNYLYSDISDETTNSDGIFGNSMMKCFLSCKSMNSDDKK